MIPKYCQSRVVVRSSSSSLNLFKDMFCLWIEEYNKEIYERLSCFLYFFFFKLLFFILKLFGCTTILYKIS